LFHSTAHDDVLARCESAAPFCLPAIPYTA
jgi:hypothetical protein